VRWKEVDDKQMMELQPLLQKIITKAASALTNCVQAKDTAKSWYSNVPLPYLNVLRLYTLQKLLRANL